MTACHGILVGKLKNVETMHSLEVGLLSSNFFMCLYLGFPRCHEDELAPGSHLGDLAEPLGSRSLWHLIERSCHTDYESQSCYAEGEVLAHKGRAKARLRLTSRGRATLPERSRTLLYLNEAELSPVE